jgi:hypothetical protein
MHALPKHHRVDLGKNWQGWHYGFNLPASIDHMNRLSGVCFTPATVYDGDKAEELVKGSTKGVVGDSHEGRSRLREKR